MILMGNSLNKTEVSEYIKPNLIEENMHIKLIFAYKILNNILLVYLY